MHAQRPQGPSRTVRKVLAFCLEHRLLRVGNRVLAAVSGGSDSVALLAILDAVRNELELDLGVVHLEHGLRGAESRADEVFVESLARARRMPFFSKRVRAAEERAEGESIEEAARRLRIAFFSEVLRAEGYASVATGHTLDDQLETVVFRLLSGTGPRGFSGIEPGSGVLIHPLLCATREELRAYLANEGSAWREDATNRDRRIPRNRIRHDLLPLLGLLNARYGEHILNLANTVKEDDRYIAGVAERALRELVIEELPGRLRVDYGAFCAHEPPVRARVVLALVERLAKRGEGAPKYLPFDVVSRMARANEGANKTLYADGALSVTKEYGELVFQKRVVPKGTGRYLYSVGAEGGTVFIEGIRKTVRFAVVDGLSRFEDDSIYFDFDTLAFPLQIRNRREGDRILLRGTGTKKLKSLFIDGKVPLRARDSVPLVVSGDAVAGVFCSYYGGKNRVASPHMVTASTRKVLVSTLV